MKNFLKPEKIISIIIILSAITLGAVKFFTAETIGNLRNTPRFEKQNAIVPQANKRPTPVPIIFDGTNEADVYFDPGTGIKQPGDSFEVKAMIRKTAGVNRTIRVSGAEIAFQSGKGLVINKDRSICLAPYNGLPFIKIEGNKAVFMCAAGLGTAIPELTSEGFPFASISLTMKTDALSGQVAGKLTVEKNSTRVTESGEEGKAKNVAAQGTDASFEIR